MSEPLRIFVVENEAITLMYLEDVLQTNGHIVVGSAMSAEEAIPLIKESRPEVVLLDLKLRDGSSGLAVAKALRGQDWVKAVFLTANAGELADDLEGAAAVIAKPVSQKTLASSIAYLEECVHRPPPKQQLPHGMQLAPSFQEQKIGRAHV